MDADCTESICLDVDAALDLSTKNIGVLKGLVTPDLGQGCADIVAVSLESPFECATASLLIL